MSMEKPDHHDADLVLHVYELRREPVMRESRLAILRDLWPKTFEDLQAVLKPEHPLNRAYRQVGSYWEMVYSFARHGIVHHDFWLENNGEGMFVFARVAPYVEQLRQTALATYTRGSGPGFLAGVDHQRQLGFARGLNVDAESPLLRVARAVVVVIVEPRLADRHHLRVLGRGDEVGNRHVRFLGGMVRMRADRAIDVVETLGDGAERGEFPDLGRDRHQARDLGGAGAREHGIELGGKIGKIEVAVAVDEHQLAFSSGST